MAKWTTTRLSLPAAVAAIWCFPTWWQDEIHADFHCLCQLINFVHQYLFYLLAIPLGFWESTVRVLIAFLLAFTLVSAFAPTPATPSSCEMTLLWEFELELLAGPLAHAAASNPMTTTEYSCQSELETAWWLWGRAWCESWSPLSTNLSAN